MTTEEEFLAEGGIPVEQLTPDENRIIDGLVEKVWKAGCFDRVSTERTAALVEAAEQAGADSAEAVRLVRHFDAATRFVQSMPEPDKQRIYARVQGKFGPQSV